MSSAGTLTFRLGKPGSFARQTFFVDPKRPGTRKTFAAAVADYCGYHCARELYAAGKLVTVPPADGITPVGHLDCLISVDREHRFYLGDGLPVYIDVALLMADGTLPFEVYVDAYAKLRDKCWNDIYCERCKGSGQWSAKKKTLRACPKCNGDGLHHKAPLAALIRRQHHAEFTENNIDALANITFTDKLSMLLNGRLVTVREGCYVTAKYMASLWQMSIGPYIRGRQRAKRRLTVSDLCDDIYGGVTDETLLRLRSYLHHYRRLGFLKDLLPDLGPPFLPWELHNQSDVADNQLRSITMELEVINQID